MVTRISSARRRVALVGSGVLLLGTAAVITTAAASSGAHPAQNPHRYADYLDGQSSGDPCAQPLNQRSGGWVCPAAGSQK